MKILDDYSGEFIPEMHFEMFSKDTLIELLRLYARFYMAVDGFWYLSVKERSGDEEALACDLWVWEKAIKYESDRLTKLMGIHGDDVVALVKDFQVSPWFWNFDYRLEVRDKNYAVLTVIHCPTLLALEKEGEGREENICKLVEPKIFQNYASFFNPAMEVKCLKSPPRKSKNEICCQWEFKLEDKKNVTPS